MTLRQKLTLISRLRYSRPSIWLESTYERQGYGDLGESGPEGAQGPPAVRSHLAHARRVRREAALHGRRSGRHRGGELAAGSDAFHARRALHHVCGPPMDHPPICGLLDRRRIQRLLPKKPRGGADGPFGGLRSGDASRLRQRSSARVGRCWQSRRGDRQR